MLKAYVAIYMYWDTTDVLCCGSDKEKTYRRGLQIGKARKLTGWKHQVSVVKVERVK